MISENTRFSFHCYSDPGTRAVAVARRSRHPLTWTLAAQLNHYLDLMERVMEQTRRRPFRI